jgi:hypothetical protein
MPEPSDAALPSGPGGQKPEGWQASVGTGGQKPEGWQASVGTGGQKPEGWQASVRPGGFRLGAGALGAEQRDGGPASARDGGPASASPAGPPLLAALALVILGTVLLGVAAGFIWAAVAPRAVIVVVGRGAANVVNPETSAFIAADGWFSLLAVAGGVISGLLGYVVAVRRHGAVAMAGILVGALAAALIARWIGQQPGQAAVDHTLALGRAGTLLQEPLALGGIGPLAFWPLAAGLAAGGTELAVLARARLRRPPSSG